MIQRFEEPPPAWECLEDRLAAFMDEHPEIDDVNDAIEALIWGEENDDAHL